MARILVGNNLHMSLDLSCSLIQWPSFSSEVIPSIYCRVGCQTFSERLVVRVDFIDLMPVDKLKYIRLELYTL